jgi:hypothetical protein
MKQVLAAQLAEWLENNTQGYAKRYGNIINIEGKIDAYDLVLYVQSLLAGRTTEQIHENNKISYTGRSDLDRRNDSFSNAAVEGADW